MILHSDLRPAFERIPGLNKLIPREYGGTRKESFDEIFGKLCLSKHAQVLIISKKISDKLIQ